MGVQKSQKLFLGFLDAPKTGSTRFWPKSYTSFESQRVALHVPIIRSSRWTTCLFTVSYLSYRIHFGFFEYLRIIFFNIGELMDFILDFMILKAKKQFSRKRRCYWGPFRRDRRLDIFTKLSIYLWVHWRKWVILIHWNENTL